MRDLKRQEGLTTFSKTSDLPGILMAWKQTVASATLFSSDLIFRGSGQCLEIIHQKEMSG